MSNHEESIAYIKRILSYKIALKLNKIKTLTL